MSRDLAPRIGALCAVVLDKVHVHVLHDHIWSTARLQPSPLYLHIYASPIIPPKAVMKNGQESQRVG